jgi:group I intron endonuclease
MIIYKVINISNNKIYIGKSDKTLENRKYMHEYLALYKNSNYLFHKAIRKYGSNNFIWEIVEEIENEVVLNDKEIFYIDHFKSKYNQNGYNVADGGKGGDWISNHPNLIEIKKKISEKVKNNYKDESFKKLMKERIEKRTEKVNKKIYEDLINKYGKEKADEIYKEKQDIKNHKFKMKNDPIYKKEIKNKKNKKISESLKIKYKDPNYYNKFCEINRSIDRKNDKNPMFNKTQYEYWIKKYGKEKADKILKKYKEKLSSAKIGEKNPMFIKVDDNIKKQIINKFRECKNINKLQRDFKFGRRVIERILKEREI